MKKPLRCCLLLAITAVVAGCKLAVIVVEGGEVQSTASGTCAEGTICIYQVEDTSYGENFTATPNPGWRFKKWNSGEAFFCADSIEPTCLISAQGAEGNELIEAVIASDATFYLMPIFEPSPPITDTVTFNGNVWAQADLFQNIPINEITAVCPFPEGLCDGFLNGYDVTGWIWASIEAVSDLLVSLGGPPLRYPPTYHDGGVGSDWAPAFFNLGFRSNFESAGRAYIAMTSTTDKACNTYPPACGVDTVVVDRSDPSVSDFVELLPIESSIMERGMTREGVWLYKPQSSGP